MKRGIIEAGGAGRKSRFPVWWASHRSGIYRWLTAVLLWIIVLACFAISARTLGLTEGVVAQIRGTAMTPEQVVQQQAVCETARAFISEYLTFDGDQEDYTRRLGPYGTFTIPSGEQVVSYAGVQSLDNRGQPWRLTVDVHVTRYITVVADTEAMSPKRIVRRLEIAGKPMVVYTDNLRESYQISLNVDKGGIKVVGTPVLVSRIAASGSGLSDLVDNNECSPEFKVFVQQVIPMYYRGEDLANYLDARIKIPPAGGYITDNIKIVGFEMNNDTARAVVSVDLCDRDIRINQQIVMEARQVNNRWLLTRIGGF